MGNVLKQGRRKVTKPNRSLPRASLQNQGITPDLNPGTADIVIDLNHPVEGAMVGLMKIAVAAQLLDHCLHMTIHLNLHKQKAIVVEDAAPLLRVRVLQKDQDRPT